MGRSRKPLWVSYPPWVRIPPSPLAIFENNKIVHFSTWGGARVVDWNGPENRSGHVSTVGSKPTFPVNLKSAI